MITSPSEALKGLRVAVKGGGSLVSHPPVFSPDSKTLYVIQNNSLLQYDTGSGRCRAKFFTPSASPIANVAFDSGSLLVFTSNGELLQVSLPSLELQSTKIIHSQWSRHHPPVITVINFIWPASSGSGEGTKYFFVLALAQDTVLPSIYSVSLVDLVYKFECKNVVGQQGSMGAGRGGRFVAGIQKDALFVKDMESGDCKWHRAGSRLFTSLAVHPTEWMVATGDDSGRIVLWSNILEDNRAPVGKTIYHWHTLPLATLTFTSNGAHLYSGGGECALVKWELNNMGNKRVLPRLGLPIRHITTCKNNLLVALSHADNCIQLVSPFNEVVLQIQNLTQCYIPQGLEDANISEMSLGGARVFGAGLHLDPNNTSLVTNGRPGQLQCYSFREDRHLYNLDITQQNYVTAERNNPISNPEVTQVSFSKDGSWLATTETRTKQDTCLELRLKFWNFEKERQRWVLNTSIEWPHEGGISSLALQPSNCVDILIGATSGGDCKFKTWGIIRDSGMLGKKKWWNCEFVGSFRGLGAGPLCFSGDGSILAVAFAQIPTLWATDTNELKATLCHSRLTENIRFLQFGSLQSSHLLISCASSSIAVWDVTTSSLLWVAPYHVESLAVDPFTNLAAAFSSKQHLIFFSPDKPEPLAIHKNVSGSRVMSSIFVPSSGSSTGNEIVKSTLFFLNSSQELCALLPPMDEIELQVMRVAEDVSVLTPFAQLIAEKTVYEDGRKKGKEDKDPATFGLQESYKVLHDIMEQSPHTMPSLTYFCSKLLQSLSLRRHPGEQQEQVEAALHSTSPHIKYNKTEDSMQDEVGSGGIEDDGKREEGAATQSKLPIPLNPPHPVFPPPPHQWEVDLDAVAQDDTSWIDQIFS